MASYSASLAAKEKYSQPQTVTFASEWSSIRKEKLLVTQLKRITKDNISNDRRCWQFVVSISCLPISQNSKRQPSSHMENSSTQTLWFTLQNHACLNCHRSKWKTRSEATQTLRAGCSKSDPQTNTQTNTQTAAITIHYAA